MSSSTADTITLCANCGKDEESAGDLKSCTACKMVKYCNRDCQIAHRPQHKKACKKRAAELYDEVLFQDPRPRDECPICMLPLPLDARKSMFKACCGKLICDGCIVSMTIEEMRKGKKKEELGICPFCRTCTLGCSINEEIEQIKKLMVKGNAYAFYTHAVYYAEGRYGVPRDYQKANELFLKGGELGCASGYCNVGNAYDNGMGVDRDKKKAKHYYEQAAMMGSVAARHNLGCIEAETGNHRRAMKHFILAARAGLKQSLDSVKQGYMGEFVTREEYEGTLRAYQKSVDEMKSEARDKAAMIAQSAA